MSAQVATCRTLPSSKKLLARDISQTDHHSDNKLDSQNDYKDRDYQDNQNSHDDMAEFDRIVLKKTEKERAMISLLNTTKRLMNINHDLDKQNEQGSEQMETTDRDVQISQSEQADASSRVATTEPPFGDFLMESLVQIGVPNFPIDSTETSKLLGYKRDFVVLDISSNSMFDRQYAKEFGGEYQNITQYNVYAVTYGSDTRVINLIRKKELDLPIIMYYKTNNDPSQVVEQVYQYEKERARSIFLKKNVQYINNPTKQYVANLNLINSPRPDLLFNGAVVANVPSELIELSLIIKTKRYISSASHEDLLRTVDYLTIF
ncbi:hypothetical protein YASMINEVIRUS_966 [Yasminevirus sp. GU-2018]|uniref:Uncharacterized protein n=1 Tax=Yasminevirus sp. GU-2018 TaxID=2420051 RepID=A0A5K0UAL9_9VIRU|nr:hypothetical protein YASMINEVIRUS_966 [Yasminevirus sp. GU-2018]